MTEIIEKDALTLKRDAAQAMLDQWQNKKWRMGYADCVRLVAAHLRKLGHSVNIPAEGGYRTVRSAQRELEKRGHANLEDWLQSYGATPIPPAAAIVGDVIMLPAEHELGALTICLGNGRVLGWHDSVPDGATVLQPVEFVAAWRINPR